MRLVVDLILPTEARLVPRTRRVFSGYLEELGVDRETTHDVMLALDEACANVIRHAFPGGGPHSFRLRAELSDAELRLVVEDDGVGFEPTLVDLTDAEATTGRGLKIIREVMTAVDVESRPGAPGTRVSMRKELVMSQTQGERDL
jgi:serine/threonine-protein kinase RsbW